jgi:hypothetical protein
VRHVGRVHDDAAGARAAAAAAASSSASSPPPSPPKLNLKLVLSPPCRGAHITDDATNARAVVFRAERFRQSVK